MFDPTKEVPSLELCEKLKEAGFPQDGVGWHWVKKPTGPAHVGYTYEWKLILIEDIHRAIDYYKVKAPTVHELLEWLSKKLLGRLPMSVSLNMDALVKTLLYYIPNGNIDFKKVVREGLKGQLSEKLAECITINTTQ